MMMVVVMTVDEDVGDDSGDDGDDTCLLGLLFGSDELMNVKCSQRHINVSCYHFSYCNEFFKHIITENPVSWLLVCHRPEVNHQAQPVSGRHCETWRMSA